MQPHSHRLCVAPMMDWTDRHCRVFHRLLAPHARLYTEMVHAHAVVRGDRARLLGFDPVEHPLALQLGGSEPALLAEAARIGEQWGYDEVNLNVGCPSERVQSGSFGACLMREPALVADGLAAMKDAVRIPVTVKHRLGVDDQDEIADLDRFVETIAAAGIDTFVVHARKAWLKGLSPKENREIPPLQHERVHALKRSHPSLRIVINGGIVDLEGSVGQLAHVDGVMLGRAAYHDPYLLARLDAALFASSEVPAVGASAPPPGAESVSSERVGRAKAPAGEALPTREAVIESMRPYVEARLAAGDTLHHMTRHWLGLYQGRPGARNFRRILAEQGNRREARWDVVERALDAVRAPLRDAA